MSVIYGNPIITNGGVKLNIDYGATPPSDTTKLWVPLSTKPSSISLQTGVDVGDFASKTINIVDTNGNQASIPQYSGIADDGNGGWYCFGGGEGTVSYGPKASKNIWHITASGVISKIAQTLVYVTAIPWCIRNGSYIYIFGGFKNPPSYNQAGGPMVQKFNIQTRETTYVWSSEQIQYTTSSGGPWWDGCKLFKYGKYLILAGGNYQSNDLYGSNGQGGNQIRYYDTTSDTIVFKKIFAEVGVYAQAKPCAITSNLVVSPYPSSALGYRYNLDTYSADKEVPAVPSDKVAIVNRSSVPFFYSGKSYVVATNGKIYEYNQTTNSFSAEPIKQITTELETRNYTWCYNDGHIYMPYSSRLYVCDAQTPLANNNMIISLDIDGAVWKALNTKDVSASVYPIKVLVGDTDGWAVQKDAYLYDTATNKWTKLDGSSTYQDMQNALNILGVN